jgi:hypothetical protein
MPEHTAHDVPADVSAAPVDAAAPLLLLLAGPLASGLGFSAGSSCAHTSKRAPSDSHVGRRSKPDRAATALAQPHRWHEHTAGATRRGAARTSTMMTDMLSREPSRKQ